MLLKLMVDRRKKDFLTNAFEDAGKAIGGVLHDIGENPVIKDIGKAINSEQILADVKAAAGDVGNALKSTKERNKGVLDGGNEPVRVDAPGSPDSVAQFVEEQDRIPLILLRSLGAANTSPTNYQGFQLTSLGDEMVKAWVNMETGKAIIAIRPVSELSESKALANIIDDTLLAQGGNNCASLSTTTAASYVVDDIMARGFTDVHVVGFSLGGATCRCLGEKYPNITRAIMFNPGSPVTGGAVQGPANGVYYHIVGDALSTHMVSPKTIRVYLLESGQEYAQTETQLQLDGVIWDEVGYYHSLDRFMEHGRAWRYESPQFEQNSLENFVFKDTLLARVVDIGGAVTSQHLNPFKKVQKLVCSNPIPGSAPSRSCHEQGPEIGWQIAGAAIGGALGAAAGLVSTAGVATPAGVLAGVGIGTAVTNGEKGLWDFIPGVSDAIDAIPSQAAPALEAAQAANRVISPTSIKRDVGGPRDSLVKRVRVQ